MLHPNSCGLFKSMYDRTTLSLSLYLIIFYLTWRRSYYIVFLSETSELHLYLMWRGSWILCQLGPQSSALLAPQGQVLGIQRAASNLEQNRVCIWGFYICIRIFHLYLYFFTCICTWDKRKCLWAFPWHQGSFCSTSSARSRGERNQSNQILLGLTERHF